TGGDVRALVLDEGVVAVGEGVHEPVHEGGLRGGDHLLVGRVQPAVADVLPDGAAEQHRVLEDYPHPRPHGAAVQGADVHAVQADPARVDLVEAHDQV